MCICGILISTHTRGQEPLTWLIQLTVKTQFRGKERTEVERDKTEGDLNLRFWVYQNINGSPPSPLMSLPIP